MKKPWYILLSLTAAVLALAACSDDDPDKKDGSYSSPLNSIYTNKSSAKPGSPLLVLGYNNENLTGKEVYFEMQDESSAKMTFFGIMPCEPLFETASFQVHALGESYVFSGSDVSATGTSFTFNGSVREGEMELNLLNVTIAENDLQRQGTWKVVHQQDNSALPGGGTHFTKAVHFRVLPYPADDFLADSILGLAGNALGALVSSMLDEVRFAADGNVTAKFAPLPDDIDIQQDIVGGNGVTNRPDSDWNLSPRMMAWHNVRDPYLYVRPDLEMILNRITSRSEEATNEDPTLADKLLDVYRSVNRWTTEGIRLNVRNNTASGNDSYEGDIIIYLDKEELMPLLPLIPDLKDIIPQEIKDQIGFVFDIILTKISNVLNDSETLEIGIYLSR